MPPNDTVSVGSLRVPASVQKAVGMFAMSRTAAFTIILCCAIITGGFVYAARAFGSPAVVNLEEYAKKAEVKKMFDEERAVYTSLLADIKKTAESNQSEFRAWAHQIDQRIFDLASRSK